MRWSKLRPHAKRWGLTVTAVALIASGVWAFYLDSSLTAACGEGFARPDLSAPGDQLSIDPAPYEFGPGRDNGHFIPGILRLFRQMPQTAAQRPIHCSQAEDVHSGRYRQLLRSYLAAPKIPIALPFGPLTDVAPDVWPQFFQVDLDESACRLAPAVTFRYSPLDPGRDFTRTITIARRAQTEGLTHIFLPVFDHFVGLAASDDSPGCLVGASRFVDVAAVPVLLASVLQPDWETKAPVYQRLLDWDSDARLPPFRDLPSLKSWGVGPGVTTSTTWRGRFVVQGDATSGIQLTSPAVAAAPGARVSIRASVEVQQGVVCVGALNGTGEKWLAAPHGPVFQFGFVVDSTGGFMLATANCGLASGSPPTRFTIASPTYTIEAPPRRNASR